ncbi:MULTISPECIES: GGDEF domain-containing protein [Vibrio]|uniref:diguanylate cyclase n=2 Tax=Vibrio TaxID=662 RepID=A0A7X4LMZ7_9VIBR|nr:MULTISPECIES: GGDEF domain-containing protein [Vibrio]MBF9001864.1 GGDEF domain-containing protein [Vibrio nitrifigilis]MZI94751.1 diguanylate cyclase [Vibrio eleionomae]
MENLVPHNNDNAPMSPVLFRRLLLFAMFCFSAIWLIDEWGGVIANFERWSYPACIALFAGLYFLSFTQRLTEKTLHFSAYIIVASYLILTSIWHHMGTNGMFSNAAQWLGLNYVIAYLFLEVRRAVPTTVVVYVITIVGHFWALRQYNSFDDTMSVVLKIGLAHLAYVVLLGTALKLRIDNYSHKARACALEYYIKVDPLTNLLNRRGIESAIEEKDLERVYYRHHYAILILDIDHFKRVNDELGHLMGDDVLVKVANTLLSVTCEHDIVGRWGGEEFLIVSHSTSQREVMQLAEKIRHSISTISIDDVPPITVSIGVSFSEEAPTFIQCLDIADNNLYCAKHGGRNQVVASPHFELSPIFAS